MRSRILSAALVVLTTSAAMLTSLPDAEAGAPFPLEAKLAKRTTGPYRHHIAINLDPSQAKNTYFKAKNNTDEKYIALELADFSPPAAYAVKYFRGSEDITAAVQSNGYSFNLRAGKAKLFRIRIKAPVMPFDACITTTVSEFGPDNDYATVRVNNPNQLCPAP